MSAPAEWTPLATSFFTDPKVRQLGRDGALLFLAGLCHCQHHVTDGFIAQEVVPVLAVQAWVKPGVAEVVAQSGMWVPVLGGWRVAAWSEWNRPADEIEERKRRDRERKSKRRSADVPRTVRGNGVSESADVRDPPSPTPIENYLSDGTTPGDPQGPVDNSAGIAASRERLRAAALLERSN